MGLALLQVAENCSDFMKPVIRAKKTDSPIQPGCWKNENPFLKVKFLI